MNITEAKKIRIVDYLRQIGHEPKRICGTQYWYLSPFRDERTPSFKVNDLRNEWYDFAVAQGGDIIDLGKLLYNTSSIKEVLEKIEGHSFTCSHVHPIVRAQERAKEEMRDICVMPLQNHTLMSYLSSRRIDLHIARKHCKEIHYELRGRQFYAIAFGNKSGGFEVRNPYFKGCINGKDITMVKYNSVGLQEHCCVMEGFMDFLSYLTIQKNGNNEICIEMACDYIVMNSVHNLKKCLALLQEYKYIHCYLDNDLAGQKTVETIVGLYADKVTDESIRYKDFKDLNDFLRGRLR